MLTGQYYDGKSSRAHSVQLRVEARQLVLKSSESATAPIIRQTPLHELRVSERLRHASRIVSFADGAQLHVNDGIAFAQLLQATGFRESAITRWQQKWGSVAIALVATVLILLVAYRWGLPYASDVIATQIPPEWTRPLSQQTLSLLDKKYTQASTLPAERQQALNEGLRQLVKNESGLPALRIEYRQAPKLGPNAFALPDGTILLTDELVALAAQDQEVLAVLAHEVGHIYERHGLRMAIQSSFVGFVIGWYLGDISSLIAGVSAALLEARYSRDFEFAADQYGAKLLMQQQRSPLLLVSMLEKLEAAAQAKQSQRNLPDQKDTGKNLGEYFASHPDTAERIRQLREISGS